MKNIPLYSLTFVFLFLIRFSIQAQNDTLRPQSLWLSDSVFAEPSSLKPPATDSLALKKDSLPAKTVSETPAVIFPDIAYVSVSGISREKDRKSIITAAKKTKDSLNLRTQMEAWTEYLSTKGKIECHFEGFRYYKDSLSLFFHEGRTYFFDSVKIQPVPSRYLDKAGVLTINKKHPPLDWENLEGKLKGILYEYQKMGYPFAQMNNRRVEYHKSGKDSVRVDVNYDFEKGIKFTIDSIIIKGKYKETPRLIYTMIGLSPGEVYNQEAIDNIPRILNNTIYYKSVKPPKTEFTYIGNSKVIIQLEPRRANKFDVLVGILPPSNTVSSPDADRRFQWIASMDIILVSMLKYGESLQLKYDQLTEGTRKMNLKLQIPYLIHLPLHVNGEFELFKQKSDFLNRVAKAGVEYGFSPFFSAKFQYKARFTGLDTSYVNAVLKGQRPPDILDGNTQSYSLTFRYEHTDNRFNPTNGWSGNIELGAGKTVIKRNIRLPVALYDSLSLTRQDSLRWSQPVLELDFWIKWYYKIGKRNVIHLANRSYYLQQKRTFQNNQIQLGGSRTIRGFNENQFFSNRYTYFTAEYRLLLEQNTYLFTFCDAGWLKDDVLKTDYFPVGLGLGLTYDTPAGLVTFSYAFGQAGDIPFQPGRGKIHLGLISQF